MNRRLIFFTFAFTLSIGIVKVDAMIFFIRGFKLNLIFVKSWCIYRFHGLDEFLLYKIDGGGGKDIFGFEVG